MCVHVCMRTHTRTHSVIISRQQCLYLIRKGLEREAEQGEVGREKMLINDNLDWGMKDMGESGLKGSQCKQTHTHTFTGIYTLIHKHNTGWVWVKQCTFLTLICEVYNIFKQDTSRNKNKFSYEPLVRTTAKSWKIPFASIDPPPAWQLLCLSSSVRCYFAIKQSLLMS